MRSPSLLAAVGLITLMLGVYHQLLAAQSYRLDAVISSGTTGNKPITFHLDQHLGPDVASRVQALTALRDPLTLE